MKKYILPSIIICASIFSMSSQSICPSFEDLIRIENVADVPTVTPNGDGTVTLSHPDPLINDVFEGYEISEFVRAFPSSTSPALVKLYTMRFNSKQLLQDIIATIPSTRYTVTIYEPEIPIEQLFIDYVDGKEFNVLGYTATSDVGCTFDCPFIMASDDFSTRISFDYNANTELLKMETINPISCAYSFSLELAGPIADTNGGSNVSNLQSWVVNSGNSGYDNQNQECDIYENTLAYLFDLSCTGLDGFQLSFIMLPDTNELIFKKANAIFGENNLLLRDATLSIDENLLDAVIVYETNGNPYLQVVNTNSLELSFQLFDINGKLVIEKVALRDNTVNISAVPQALYFIELTDANGNKQVVKFLKR